MTLPSGRSVLVIGELGPNDSNRIVLQDFNIGGEMVIPIFSDEVTFRAQTATSPFAARGIEINLDLLCSMMRGNEVFVLDPGSEQPQRLSLQDLCEMTLEQR